MSNETKTNRTQLTDLPVAEQEMTAQEMAKVQGGKAAEEKKKDEQQIAGKSGGTNPLSPAPNASTARQTPKRDFGD